MPLQLQQVLEQAVPGNWVPCGEEVGLVISHSSYISNTVSSASQWKPWATDR
jgi:hypothetical protein